MKNIVLIAPFEELGKMAEKIVDENGFDVDVIVGDLSEGVRVARKAIEQGARLLISRGGTYKVIKNAVDVPVVEIKMSSFDILRGFKNLFRYEEQIGIIGYKNIIDGCEIIGELLGLNIELIEIKKEAEAFKVVGEAVKRGVKVFVGDTISTTLAKEFNCQSYRIESGNESIIDTIQEANRILSASKNEKAKAEQFKTIINSVHDGIIEVDHNLQIKVLNDMAERIFGIKEKDALGRKVDGIISDDTIITFLKSTKIGISEIFEINKSKFAVNKVPIRVEEQITGSIITLHDVTQIQDLEYEIRRNLLDKGLTAKYNFEDIMYESEEMSQCMNIAKKYSKYDSPILILGQSGVGKELVAQSIHNNSKRRNGPFVAINCAALPDSLIESELFGYAEGSFTGARKGGKPGMFELAHNGTILLDEIGELSLEFQARLLRVLQEKEVMRIGGEKVIPVDVRVISATNKDLYSMVERGQFREDLFFRINILTLMIPALNERKEDILLIAKYFIESYSKKYMKNISGLSNEAIQNLIHYNYKGNIRELKAMIERAVVLCEGKEIEEKHLNIKVNLKKIAPTVDLQEKNFSLEEMEIFHIRKILKLCKGNVSKAAKILKINRSTLYRKLEAIDE